MHHTLERRLTDRLVLLALIACVPLLEWIRLFTNAQTSLFSAILYSLIALVICVLSVPSVVAIRREIQACRQGIRGERHIAHYLESTCRKLGYEVLHDLPATGTAGPFNIDHLLVGPSGIFTIETKNWSLPPSSHGRATITVDGELIRKSDGTFDNTAIPQAKNIADFLRQVLAKHTAKPLNAFFVRPILILPGWYVERNTTQPGAMWVLGNNTLHKFLLHEPRRLAPDQVAHLYQILRDYQRSNRMPD